MITKMVIKNEEGWAITEILMAVVISLIMLGGVFALVNIVMSSSKVQNEQQNIATIRSGAQQLFSTSRSYSGITNTICENAGLIPSNLLTSTQGVFSHSWNGSVTIAPDTDTTLFTITYNSLPQEEAIKLATFGVGSWTKVTLNGTDIPQMTGGAVAAASAAANAGAANTIVFTSK